MQEIEFSGYSTVCSFALMRSLIIVYSQVFLQIIVKLFECFIDSGSECELIKLFEYGSVEPFACAVRPRVAYFR